MHKIGITFLVLNLLLGGFSIYMAGKFVTERNSWLEKVDKAEAEYVKLKDELATETAQNTLKKNELTRESLGWGRFFENVQVRIDDKSQGQIQAQLGSDQGLTPLVIGGRPILPTLYGFMQVGNDFVYAGDFLVTSIDANRCAMKLKQPPRAQDADFLTQGTWRFREQLPAAYTTPFTNFNATFAELDEQVQERTKNVDVKKKEVVAATALRDQRKLELMGNAKAPKDSGPIIIDGIVESLRKESDQRNEGLMEIDMMRRMLDHATKEFMQLKSENEALLNEKAGKSSVAGQTPVLQPN
jgi:hypothetical protein